MEAHLRVLGTVRGVRFKIVAVTRRDGGFGRADRIAATG